MAHRAVSLAIAQLSCFIYGHHINFLEMKNSVINSSLLQCAPSVVNGMQ